MQAGLWTLASPHPVIHSEQRCWYIRCYSENCWIYADLQYLICVFLHCSAECKGHSALHTLRMHILGLQSEVQTIRSSIFLGELAPAQDVNNTNV